MKTLKEKIAVMQAALDGKEIECVNRPSYEWFAITDPDWQWRVCDYRIKQEPMEFWVNICPNGNILSAHETEATSVENARLVAGVKSIKAREVTE